MRLITVIILQAFMHLLEARWSSSSPVNSVTASSVRWLGLDCFVALVD